MNKPSLYKTAFATLSSLKFAVNVDLAAVITLVVTGSTVHLLNKTSSPTIIAFLTYEVSPTVTVNVILSCPLREYEVW